VPEVQLDRYNALVAKAWADDDFKSRLLSDPADTLRSEGWEFPAGATVSVVEAAASPEQITLVLPEKPAELSDEQLDAVAGGASGFTLTMIGTYTCFNPR
jgi:hypothetical protein